MTGAQQKISRGPQNLGARGNLPPPLGGPEGDDARHGQRPLFGNHFVSDIPWTVHVGDDVTVVTVKPSVSIYRPKTSRHFTPALCELL